jgi:hypothetical protein
VGVAGRSIVDQIYEASVIPERWPAVLDRIAEFSNAAGGYILTERSGSRLWTASERLRPVLASFYAEGWHERNAWAERSVLENRRSFYDENDIFAPGETDTIPLYRDFIRPHGYGWSAGTLIRIPSGGQVGLRFERKFEDGPIHQDMKIKLNALRPHLARASLLLTRLGMGQAQSTVAVLQTLDVPAAVLTYCGRLLACNAAMDDRLSQVRIGADDRFAFSNAGAQAALKEGLTLLADRQYKLLKGPIAIPATEEHEAAMAYLIPVYGMAQDILGHGTSILIIRPARSGRRLLDLVRMQFAINAGEAQQLVRLASSISPRFALTLLSSIETLADAKERLLKAARTSREMRLATLLTSLEPI